MTRRTAHRSTRGRAVVIGGSMAGLSAAAVLSPRFESVVIVERDVVPETPAPRKGVPQGRHPHGLLPAGLLRMERWFPGITEELVAAGARSVDLGADAAWYQGGGHRHRFPTGISGPAASRPLIEHHVRQRTLALPNVSLRSGSGAQGVTASDDGTTVTGVLLADGTTLPADLVVDATGRNSRALHWLSDLGYEAPPTTEIDVDVTYASRILRREPGSDPGWALALVLAGPPTGRQGVALPIEGDRWIVSLMGLDGDRAPTDDAGYLAFARSLPSPEIADLLESAVPLGPVMTHRLRTNQRRHVEKLRRVPGGLVLLGDAVCSFNPTYGQGMTSAALQAEALERTLDRVPGTGARFVKVFYRRAAKAITPAWQLTTGADFALPATKGKKAPGTDLLNRYMSYVFPASHVSAKVARRVIEVTALLEPPQTLLTPAMMLAVFRAYRKAARVEHISAVPVEAAIAA